MIPILIFFLLIGATALLGPVMALRERKNYSVIDSLGNVVPSPVITVYNTGTVTLALIYSDNVGLGTPLANPFTGGLDGRFFFYADDGQYDVVVTGVGITTYTLTAENFVFQAGQGGTGITDINALNAVVQFLATGAAGANFNISSAGNTHTFNIPDASPNARGLLTPANWALFNNKLGNLNGETSDVQTFSVGTAGANFNIVSAANVHTFNIPIASGTTTGLLSTVDWTTFNNKQGSLAVGTNLQYVRGDLTNQTLNTSVVPEVTNLYYTDGRARLSQSATAPLVYTSATGVHSIPKATGGVDGYLAAADFTIFTNGLLTTGAQNITGVKTFLSHPLEVVDGKTMPVDDHYYTRLTTFGPIASDNTEKTVHSEVWPAPISVGRIFNFRQGGTCQTSGANTITFKLYFGAGTLVWTSGAIDLASTASLNFFFSIDVTIHTAGAAGVTQADGALYIDDTTAITQIVNTNTTAVNLNGTPTIAFTMQLSNSNPADTFSVTSGSWSVF